MNILTIHYPGHENYYKTLLYTRRGMQIAEVKIPEDCKILWAFDARSFDTGAAAEASLRGILVATSESSRP